MLSKPVAKAKHAQGPRAPKEGRGSLCREGGSWEGPHLSVAVSGSWKGEQGRVCGKEVWRGVVGRDLPARTKLEEGAAPRLEAPGTFDSVVQQGGTRVRWELHPSMRVMSTGFIRQSRVSQTGT